MNSFFHEWFQAFNNRWLFEATVILNWLARHSERYVFGCASMNLAFSALTPCILFFTSRHSTKEFRTLRHFAEWTNSSDFMNGVHVVKSHLCHWMNRKFCVEIWWCGEAKPPDKISFIIKNKIKSINEIILSTSNHIYMDRQQLWHVPHCKHCKVACFLNG